MMFENFASSTSRVGFGMHSVQMLGIINALKTGDPIVDMFIAVVLPFIISFAITQCRQQALAFWRYLYNRRFNKALYTRTIIYRTTQNSTAVLNMDEDSHNRHLIRSIKLYVHHHSSLIFDHAELELTKSVVNPTEDGGLDEKSVSKQLANLMRQGKSNGASPAAFLGACEVVKKPLQQKWHSMGEYEGAEVRLWMKDTLSVSDEGGLGNDGKGRNSSRDVELRLESSGKTSVDVFVETAFEWYVKRVKSMERDYRYYYDLCRFDGRSDQKIPYFSRYRLGEEKSFDTLFSQQAKSLLKIIDDFQQKRGKFGIPGFPYKFGLLLFGPRGTGKTSLIKALARYTRRHIVNVPLARISTNQELSSVLFNKIYNVQGHDPAKLGFRNVIFVMEDVDATSEVVTRRKPIQKTSKVRLRRSDVPRITNDDEQEAKAQDLDPPLMRAQDNLSLAGLLNAFDGVVDTPGRIVVMTTNFPDLLDPALIRPGRIDKIMELGYMEVDDFIAMLGHYFQTTLLESETTRVKRLLDGGVNITPARLEQLIMAKDSVDSVIKALECEQDDSCSSTLGMTEEETSGIYEMNPIGPSCP